MPTHRRTTFASGPPATDREIEEAEQQLGMPIPSPLVNLYREMNGLWVDQSLQPTSVHDFLLIPVQRLHETRQIILKHYTDPEHDWNFDEHWASQLLRSVPFHAPECAASFLFYTDQNSWSLPAGVMGVFDHNSEEPCTAELHLETWLQKMGRPTECYMGGDFGGTLLGSNPDFTTLVFVQFWYHPKYGLIRSRFNRTLSWDYEIWRVDHWKIRKRISVYDLIGETKSLQRVPPKAIALSKLQAIDFALAHGIDLLVDNIEDSHEEKGLQPIHVGW
jgi:hypothetical protein